MYFGVDYGLARTGVAKSDGMNLIATPVCTVLNPEGGYKPVIRKLRELSAGAEHPLEGIVLGFPDQDDPRAAGICREVLVLKAKLEPLFKVPVYLQDEVFSSRKAGELLQNSGKKKHRHGLDAAAAAVILQEWLDAGGPG